MDFFVENKWFFMVGTEVLFWVFAIAFGLIRYLFGRERLSLVVLALLIINYSLLVPLAVLDYLQSRDIELFQVATVGFIIYVLIYGKSHFKHFDDAMKRKVSRWKGEAPARSAGAPK